MSSISWRTSTTKTIRTRLAAYTSIKTRPRVAYLNQSLTSRPSVAQLTATQKHVYKWLGARWIIQAWIRRALFYVHITSRTCVSWYAFTFVCVIRLFDASSKHTIWLTAEIGLASLAWVAREAETTKCAIFNWAYSGVEARIRIAYCWWLVAVYSSEVAWAIALKKIKLNTTLIYLEMLNKNVVIDK